MQRSYTQMRDLTDKSITYNIPISAKVSSSILSQGVIVIKNKNPLKGENMLMTVHEVNHLMREYREILKDKISDILQKAYNLSDKKIFIWLWKLLSLNSDEPFSFFGETDKSKIGYMPIICLLANRPNIKIQGYPDFCPEMRDIIKREEWKYFTCMNTHLFDLYFDVQGVMLLDQLEHSRVYSVATQSEAECVDYWSYKKKTSDGDPSLDAGTELYLFLNRDNGKDNVEEKSITLKTVDPVPRKLTFVLGKALYLDTSYKGRNKERKYMVTGIPKCYVKNGPNVINDKGNLSSSVFSESESDYDRIPYSILTNLISEHFENTVLLNMRHFATLKKFITRHDSSHRNYVTGDKSVTESYLKERTSRSLLVEPFCKQY